MIGAKPPSETYVTYLWKSPDVQSPSICPGIASVTLLESRTLIERGTTGLTTWTASISLAEFLIKHPGAVNSLLTILRMYRPFPRVGTGQTRT